jgi:hypothetical protein
VSIHFFPLFQRISSLMGDIQNALISKTFFLQSVWTHEYVTFKDSKDETDSRRNRADEKRGAVKHFDRVFR